MADERLAVQALAGCPLFSGCEIGVLRTIAGRLRVRHFDRNDVIFHQGEAGDALHIIALGAVKIVLPSAEGGEAIIATLRPPDFFGELALLDGQPRSASAAAVEPTDTLVLARSVFLELIDTHVGLRDALLASLAGELRRLTTHVEELHFLGLAGRLARRLAQLADDAAPSAAGEVTLDWPYTQSDLAAMIGGTRQSVNRLLGGLIAEGMVRIERDAIVVVDPAALARAAEP